jgi:endonuclease YncB( thermonuclease family)
LDLAHPRRFAPFDRAPVFFPSGGVAMRTPIRILSLLLGAAVLAAPAPAPAVTAEAIGAQTLRLATGEVVELSGIRAPDARDSGHAHAREYLAFLIRDQELQIERSEDVRDEDGVMRRSVWVRRSVERDLVNREMVQAGYGAAYVTRASDPEALSLVEAEIDARQHRRGLWGTIGVPQWLIGNIRSRIFHTPACPTLPLLRHVIPFESRDQAIRCYYRPCRLCLPF